ncbi:acetylxylan esterase [Streptomyces sp. T-3]|nr:acetylxylan esterase [Streptomyces sp. T-3]
MPLTDLPLDELRTYSAAHPEPVDFDAFWQETLAEARSTAPSLTVTPVHDTHLTASDVYDVRFPGWRGQPVAAWLVRPRDSYEPRPVVIAARTDPDLRTQLSETRRRFFADIIHVARLVPGTELFSDEELEMLVNTVEHTFDGETIRREIAPDPVAEEHRLALICEFAEFYVMRRLADTAGRSPSVPPQRTNGASP